MSEDFLHGGALDAVQSRFGDAPTPWIDISTGINPWPYPDTQISASAHTLLPTQTLYETCQKAMARAIGVEPDTLVLAPGSELLIRLLPSVVSAKTIAILSPSYGDHARAWQGDGRTVIETADPLALADKVDAIIICQPNNPDGRVFSAEALDDAMAQLNRKSGWLIIDEAYVDLAPNLSLAPRAEHSNMVILRSFGKFFGLAGLRLGGLIAPQSVRTAMRQRLGEWPVSGAALEIGARAYADLEWQDQIRQKLTEKRIALDAILTEVGIKAITGTDLFRYIETPGDAHALWTHLAHSGIYARRFDWTQRHLRIGLPKDQNSLDRLQASLSLSR